jgi:hypothetical protein
VINLSDYLFQNKRGHLSDTTLVLYVQQIENNDGAYTPPLHASSQAVAFWHKNGIPCRFCASSRK